MKRLLAGAAVVMAACQPLPKGSVDPLTFALGIESPGAGPAHPAPERSGTAQSSHEAVPPGGSGDWLGPFKDSRGQGQIVFRLVRDGNALGGTWRLRTGSVAGNVAGEIDADGRTLSFSMRGGDPACAVDLAGSGEWRGDEITAHYEGTDCYGAVTGGNLNLQKVNR